MEKNIYPCTIINDRYNGSYSCAKWTAWELEINEIPYQIDLCDVTCQNFWEDYEGVVGKGNTPDEAYNDLLEQLKEN